MDIVEAGVGLLAGGLLLAGILSPMLLDDPPPRLTERPGDGTLALSADEEPNAQEAEKVCPDDRKGRDRCDDDERGEGKRKHHDKDDRDDDDEEEDEDDD